MNLVLFKYICWLLEIENFDRFYTIVNYDKSNCIHFNNSIDETNSVLYNYVVSETNNVKFMDLMIR